MAITREIDLTDENIVFLGYGEVLSVNISEKKGQSKTPIKKAVLLKNVGMQNDAHAYPEDETRQVSFLAIESIERQNQKLKGQDKESISLKELLPGAFAENITVRGISFSELKLNDIIEIGKNIVLEVSRIGKECLSPCSIFYQTGDCIMPREGFFARVIEGGDLYPNAVIKIKRKNDKLFEIADVKGKEDLEVLNGA